MIIPSKGLARDEKVKHLIDCCTASRADRISLYDRRRRYFLFGTYGYEKVLYNRIMSHTDLVASFLYSADHARYDIGAPANAPLEVVAQIQAVEDSWNDEFRDSGLAYDIPLALLWAIVYDSMFLKVGWNDARKELYAKMVQPHDFGVYDERETDLDSQEAFVHTYHLNWDNAVMRLLRAGLRSEIPKLATSAQPTSTLLPPALASMLVTATGGANLGGPVMGQVYTNYEPKADYEARTEPVMVAMHELYVWDDLNDDYVTFTCLDNGTILSDSRDTIAAMTQGRAALSYGSKTNLYIPGEHPFVHMCPFQLPDYFWGESHTDRLINLQTWSNETLDNIHEILERQVDPAKVFSGFSGLSDEKAGALGGPGSFVMDMLPNAKVEELKPEMPPDLFADFNSIGAIFLEASGLTETVSGRGEQGVRGRGHAKQLATTGSGRIRKVAVGLEPPLVRLGDLCLRIVARNDPHRIVDEKGNEFVLAQVGDWRMRIAGHSHSPLFNDEAKEESVVLLKAQAIDREMFIRLRNPPGASQMIDRLRQRLKIEAQMRAANPPEEKHTRKKGNGVAPATPV